MAGLASATLVAGLALAGLPASPAAAAPDGSPQGEAVVEQQVRDELAAEGTTSFWVHLQAKADLGAAEEIDDWVERGQFVYDQLTSTAQTSQGELVAMLDSAGVDYQTYWISNVVKVTGDAALLERITGLAGVDEITADRVYQLPEPAPGQRQARINAVEWNIDRINAPQVWNSFGVRGEGIVVANMDSGVQFDHPALVNQYRGNQGDGSFDHNYNWFDPSGDCPSPAPCDDNGHGTHTMGTAVGDDGGDNQIGVAPGARWIAAKGCNSSGGCPTQDLLDSFQWFLAPTDLQGENPDPAMRPHVVNNSWGSSDGGSTTYLDSVQAWVAAGIFPVFSNGNSGPGCGTVGSPGSYTETYGVGAFDINNNIAGFSSRGASPIDGGIKPNVSAPGVDIRSSVPGGYAPNEGTSMAAPHVTGTVALMWSSSIILQRDLDATRALLDQTAIDTEDLQCGGTPENNNVWGQGRLDAFAAVEASPRGPTGTLEGTVSDSQSGDPIAGATVTITGPVDRQVETGPDGTYAVTLLVGDYDATAEAFGYQPQTQPVTITEDATTTQNFPLEAVDSATITGTVTDGSGHGWSLYARVDVEGTPVDTFTDPVTGQYRLTLPANDSYSLVFEPQYPGYSGVTETVDLGESDVTLDLALEVALNDCRDAPGYRLEQPAMAMVTSDPGDQFAEYFDARGVTVDFFDNADVDQVTGYDLVLVGYDTSGGWDEAEFLAFLDRTDAEGTGVIFLDHAFTTGNGIKTLSRFTGNPVSTDTSTAGFGQQNLYEVTQSHPILAGFEVGDRIIHEPDESSAWLAWFDGYEGENRQVIADVGRTEDGILGSGIGVQQRPNNRHVLMSIHSSSGSRGPSSWSTDSDAIFWNAMAWVNPEETFECVPVEGGLVLGQVQDLNTGDGVNGATVTSAGNPDESGDSFATPDDPGLGDGFYWLFSSLIGSQEFTASAGNYVDGTATVDVVASAANEANFALAAGQLEVEPAGVEAEMRLGQSADRTFTVTNTGTAPAELELSERRGDFEILNLDGTTEPVSPLATRGAGAPLQRIHAPVSDLSATAGGPQAAQRPASAPNQEEWQDIASYPFPTMDTVADVWDGRVYVVSGIDNASNWHEETMRYDPATDSWQEMAPISIPREKPNGAIIDGKFYVVGGWDSGGTPVTEMEIYDVATDSWSTGAPIPTAYAASSNVVLEGKLYLIGGCQTACGSTDVWVYDPGADAWSQAAPYPQLSSWTHCGAIEGQIYCAGSSSDAEDSAFVYNPEADEWTEIASLPATVWGGSYVAANGMLLVSGGVVNGTITNQGFAYDVANDSWETLPNANNALYRGASACGFYRIGGAVSNFNAVPDAEVLPGFDACREPVDVPWLAVDTPTATLAPGQSVTVTVSMDSSATEEQQPGAYTAGVGIRHDTPYSVDPVGVTMNVTPPNNWGKITGTVTGVDCDGNGTGPLADAVVQVNGRRQQVTLVTGGEGGYAYWLRVNNNPLNLVVAATDHIPQNREARLVPRQTVTEDFTLAAICLGGSRQLR